MGYYSPNIANPLQSSHALRHLFLSGSNTRTWKENLPKEGDEGLIGEYENTQSKEILSAYSKRRAIQGTESYFQDDQFSFAFCLRNAN
jgi:hypothetical protein